mmetsp:Transcript_5756/g.23967  ORF Transcript_5756/g.23967 Transcript_5756/m.23967 type:complete len:206 (-) Transcript_5756:1524-2141(-)
MRRTRTRGRAAAPVNIRKITGKRGSTTGGLRLLGCSSLSPGERCLVLFRDVDHKLLAAVGVATLEQRTLVGLVTGDLAEHAEVGVLDDGVLEAVDEGVGRGGDDVAVDADGGPGLARVDVAEGDHDARRGARGGLGVEDAHLVVGDLDVVQDGVRRREGALERGEEAGDGAVALGDVQRGVGVREGDLDRRARRRLGRDRRRPRN